MRLLTVVWSLILTLWLSVNVTAAPLVTPCTGSWDGVGLTACELLGRPADAIGPAYSFSAYRPGFTVLHEITSLDATNELELLGNGYLKYKRAFNHLAYTSQSATDRGQFAYWFGPTYTIVGIEDLGGKPHEDSDWDYNDYVVRFDKELTEVPEPATLVLLSLGLFAAARYRRT